MVQVNSVHRHPATSRDLIRQAILANHRRSGPRKVITDEHNGKRVYSNFLWSINNTLAQVVEQLQTVSSGNVRAQFAFTTTLQVVH